jgi:hypothetical protein
MEYLLLSLFVLLVIISLIFFLSWWQLSQFGLEEQRIKNDRVVALLNRFTNSPLFVKENSVFDDSRLLAIQLLGDDACRELEDLLGSGWFMEIEVLSRPGCAGQCSQSNYDCCNYWSLCSQGSRMNVSMSIPVNVYRKAEDRTDLAALRVGVYS